jgi:hypothetical protein
MKESSARVLAPRISLDFRFPDHDALPCFAQDFGHVGEVILAVRVGGGKLFDVANNCVHREDVESGVDLVNLLLRRAGGFFFDDGLNIGAAGLFANHAAVAGGMVEVGAE